MDFPPNVLVCFLAGQRLYEMGSIDKRPVSIDLDNVSVVEAVIGLALRHFPLQDLVRIVLLVHEQPEENQNLKALRHHFGQDRVSACTVPQALEAYVQRDGAPGFTIKRPYGIVLLDRIDSQIGRLWQYVVDDQPLPPTVIDFEADTTELPTVLGRRMAEFINETGITYVHMWAPGGVSDTEHDHASFWHAFLQFRRNQNTLVNPCLNGHELFLGAALATQP